MLAAARRYTKPPAHGQSPSKVSKQKGKRPQATKSTYGDHFPAIFLPKQQDRPECRQRPNTAFTVPNAVSLPPLRARTMGERIFS